MSDDRLHYKIHCSKCGKEITEVISSPEMSFRICAECQVSVCSVPSFLQSIINLEPQNLLVNEVTFQSSRIKEILGIEANIASTTQFRSPEVQAIDIRIPAVLSEVSVLQQTILHSSLFENNQTSFMSNNIAAASLNISNGLGSIFESKNHLEELSYQSNKSWLNPSGIVDCMNFNNGAQSIMSCVLGTALAASNVLTSFDATRMYKLYETDKGLVDLSIKSMNILTHEYKTLAEDIYSKTYKDIAMASSLVIERPPYEIYQTGILANLIAPAEEKIEKEPTTLKEIIYAREDIIAKLRSLGESFVKMYEGACNSFKSEGPDSVRHLCVSLRELITHTLHTLTPDSDVKEYFKSIGMAEEDYLFRGVLTRPSRIIYLTRKIQEKNFSKFIDADVNSTLAFMDILQNGTHALESRFSKEQTNALISRAEGLVSYFIDIGK